MGWAYNTDWGVFTIVAVGDGTWSIVFDGYTLGWYPSAESALAALVSASCEQPTGCPPTDEVGLPDDLDDWEPIIEK